MTGFSLSVLIGEVWLSVEVLLPGVMIGTTIRVELSGTTFEDELV